MRRVLVKDESSRLGLPAFKGLGVSYAMYKVICERVGEPVRPGNWDNLRAALASQPPLDFVAATDGNHGRAVARFSSLLSVRAHIFVPDVVNPEAVQAIRDEGADVYVVTEDYDKTVQFAADEAGRRDGAVLIQDTAWPGYEQIPQWIVDGYSTLFAELEEQLAAQFGPADAQIDRQTNDSRHSDARDWLVVTPMGVGSLAQAVVAHYRSRNYSRQVAVLGVEPDTAACIQTSLREDRPRSVATGSTIMDGLNCGTPSSLAWRYLRRGLDAVVAISDQQAGFAVEDLTNQNVLAGPCGAASLAAARLAAATESRRRDVGITKDTSVILLNTEGARSATEATG